MRRASLAAAALLAAVTLARLPDGCASGNALNHVSGAWMTLADDLARGVLYRPILSPAGTGGTRYFPLAFAVQAALRRAGLGPVAAGQAASLAAGALLAIALAFLLARTGASRAGAGAGVALAFAGFAAQHALLSARGDLLPVALSAAALAALAARRRVALATALLVLAFLAKPTAAGAAAAGVAFLALSGSARAARALGASFVAGAVVAVAAIAFLSAGRFAEGLAAVGGAGASARSAAAAPLRLLEELAWGDPAGLVLCAAAALVLAASLPRLAAAVRRGEEDPLLLPALWLAAAAALALAVLASPGTGVNHLVDVEAASAAVLGCSLRGPRVAALARAGTLAAALAGTVLAAGLWRADREGSRLAEIRAAAHALPAGPAFSEDPLVPLAAGASPVVLDPFALRILAEEDPSIGAPLAALLRRGAFASVVLLADPDAPRAPAWYARGNLGLPLLAAIREGYRPAGTFGPYRLLVPRAGLPRGPSAGVARREPSR